MDERIRLQRSRFAEAKKRARASRSAGRMRPTAVARPAPRRESPQGAGPPPSAGKSRNVRGAGRGSPGSGVHQPATPDLASLMQRDLAQVRSDLASRETLVRDLVELKRYLEGQNAKLKSEVEREQDRAAKADEEVNALRAELDSARRFVPGHGSEHDDIVEDLRARASAAREAASSAQAARDSLQHELAVSEEKAAAAERNLQLVRSQLQHRQRELDEARAEAQAQRRRAEGAEARAADATEHSQRSQQSLQSLQEDLSAQRVAVDAQRRTMAQASGDHAARADELRAALEEAQSTVCARDEELERAYSFMAALGRRLHEAGDDALPALTTSDRARSFLDGGGELPPLRSSGTEEQAAASGQAGHSSYDLSQAHAEIAALRRELDEAQIDADGARADAAAREAEAVGLDSALREREEALSELRERLQEAEEVARAKMRSLFEAQRKAREAAGQAAKDVAAAQAEGRVAHMALERRTEEASQLKERIRVMEEQVAELESALEAAQREAANAAATAGTALTSTSPKSSRGHSRGRGAGGDSEEGESGSGTDEGGDDGADDAAVRLVSSRTAHWAGETGKLRARLREATRERDEARSQVEDAEARAAELESRASELDGLLQEAEERARSAEEARASLVEDLEAQREAQVEAERRAEEAERGREAAVEELAAESERCAELEQGLLPEGAMGTDALRAQLEQEQSRVESLQQALHEERERVEQLRNEQADRLNAAERKVSDARAAVQLMQEAVQREQQNASVATSMKEVQLRRLQDQLAQMRGEAGSNGGGGGGEAGDGPGAVGDEAEGEVAPAPTHEQGLRPGEEEAGEGEGGDAEHMPPPPHAPPVGAEEEGEEEHGWEQVPANWGGEYPAEGSDSGPEPDGNGAEGDVLLVTVEIGEGVAEDVEVREGDNLGTVARQFVAKHGLGEEAVEALRDYLEDEVYAMREGGSVGEGEGWSEHEEWDAAPEAKPRPPPATLEVWGTGE